ncbi:MAG: hypothetical protein HY057_03600 [Rhodospirillales bacterium]|nr:hypothetical protein [Rhodospirillales bacterium]
MLARLFDWFVFQALRLSGEISYIKTIRIRGTKARFYIPIDNVSIARDVRALNAGQREPEGYEWIETIGKDDVFSMSAPITDRKASMPR